MNRRRRIASILALTGSLSVMPVPAALAASPLLSGYGAPGGGEQAVIGSTLIGGPRGGSGSVGQGGSSGSQGLSVTAQHGSGSASSGGSGAGQTGTGEVKGNSPSSGTGGASAAGAGSRTTRDSSFPGEGPSRSGDKARAQATGVYVYPTSLRLASSDSSVFAISAGDLLLLIAMALALAFLCALTRRLARLQR